MKFFMIGSTSSLNKLVLATMHLLRVGWRNIFPVVLLCLFLFVAKQFQVILTYHTSCSIVSFFLLRREIVFSCTGQFLGCGGKQFQVLLPYLSYHTSYAVVSVFWLRREIVFGYSVSKKDSYLVSLIERGTASNCVYFVRSKLFYSVSLNSLSISCTRKIGNFFISIL